MEDAEVGAAHEAEDATLAAEAEDATTTIEAVAVAAAEEDEVQVVVAVDPEILCINRAMPGQ